MSFALINLDITDYFPQNFRFDNFSFIFSSDGHDFEDEINYLSKNQIVHKALLNKKDIRYSIKILRNDSLIGISDFIIPSVFLSRKEQSFEKVCLINMTDSTKRILFGNLSPSNTLRINIKANMQYIQEKPLIKQNTAGFKKDKNKPFSPKSTNLGVKKKNTPISSKMEANNAPGVVGNPIGNFVFNKQQIPMSISSRKGGVKNNINNNNISNKMQNKFINNNNNKQNMADIILQQQKQQRIKINNFVNNGNSSNINKNINTKINNASFKQENKENVPPEEDPADISTLDEDISQPVQLVDKEFTEFMSKFIEKNPLEQLSHFKDINEMLIYTKNVIDKLLSYQQEYYERLKSSVVLNNRLNELLMKYNEKYRNIVKKVHRLNEETNSNDMRKDAVINIHRTENSNLKQIIPLKMKELKLYQEMCGEGFQNNPKEEIKPELPNKENDNDEDNKKQKILLKLIKNCISNYGPLESLLNRGNITEEDKKNIMEINEKLKLEEKSDNRSNNIGEGEGKIEYVISDNPDNLDIKLNQYLTSIYSENRAPAIIFKKIEGNLYEYGSQKIAIVDEDNIIKVQYDEGALLLDNFIEINAQAEEDKMKQVN